MNTFLELREKEREKLSKSRSEEDFYKQYDKIVSDRAGQNPPHLARDIKSIFDNLFPKTNADD
ncbi:MAG: hypothetical protein CMF96_05250 [Candidatus Marinimicrobia bacterium]|nr:hypothetical protein [Candidatus Neomarinimicrobiota bacterium]|tara:strand:+ start:2675 stop:2863 length:189 start_codon:yes stop_codon:yes gene_type:complete